MSLPYTRSSRIAGLSAATAALGIATALTQAVCAANLNSNLVVNGDFETTSSTTSQGAFFSGWSGGTADIPDANTPFGYNYAQGYDNRSGGFVPPGNSATSFDDYYWSMNGGSNVPTFQIIALGSGATAAAIAAGTASYDIRAYFSSYRTDLESGRMSLVFLNGANSVIGGPVNFDDPDRTQWSLVGGTGTIPVGTTQARITLLQNPTSGISGGPDIYVDNVAFTVIPEPSTITLSVLGLAGLFWRRRSA